VLLNRGDGSLQAELNYPTGRITSSVAIGDLTGDAKPDLMTTNPLANSVSVLANATGLCLVPKVKKKTLPAAKRTIARANCRVGQIRRAHSTRVKRGRVISQKPKPGRVLPRGGKVNLVVSRGRKR
jgi:PASTA domain/FG-GAP repeat